jgi:hypothetical protein
MNTQIKQIANITPTTNLTNSSPSSSKKKDINMQANTNKNNSNIAKLKNRIYSSSLSSFASTPDLLQELQSAVS